MAAGHSTENKPRIDLSGRTFGRWTVVRFSHAKRKASGNLTYYWECHCACGTIKDVMSDSLTSDKSISCGCHQSPKAKPAERACLTCGIVYPFTTEFFYANKQQRFGIRPKCRPCCRKSAREYGTPRSRRIRLEVLRHYSGSEHPSCQCCGEAHLEFLAIDHIHGGGSRHRKAIKKRSMCAHLYGLGFPDGYRVLCHNCNSSLGYYGYCPHQNK